MESKTLMERADNVRVKLNRDGRDISAGVIGELMAILLRLPHTADGVPIVPGMKLWRNFTEPPATIEVLSGDVSSGQVGCLWEYEGVESDDLFDANKLFSTEAAALAAAAAGEAK